MSGETGYNELELRIRGLEEELIIQRQENNDLRESAVKYHNIFNNVSDWIYIHDLKGMFLEANLTVKNVLGYTREDIPKTNVRDLMPERFKHEFDDYLKRILKTGKEEGLIILMTKAGREVIVEYWNTLVHDSTGPCCVQGLSRDITERIQAKLALKASEEKYRGILKSIEDGYYELDPAGNFTFFNDSMCRILGYSADEMMGMNNRMYMDRESAKRIFQTFNNVYLSRKPTKAVDWKLIRKDNSKCIVETSISLMQDPEGPITGFRGVLRDITERKRAEREKASLEVRLQHARKMEAIGTLAGGVAHELNNILSGVVSYPELLLMDIPEDSPLRKPILTIQNSGQKAADIVQDLLTLAGKGVVVMEVVDLNRIVFEYLGSPEYEKLRLSCPKIQVETDLDAGLLNIQGSPSHLFKIVMNLVSNAADAMHAEGTIFVSVENRYIDQEIQGHDKISQGDYVVLSVSDQGTVMSAEDTKRIFEPFYTKKEMGRSGTGLGMAVVWGAVKDHDGYIDVQSVQGKGTVFTIYLPATRQELKKEEPMLPPSDYKARGESILVVDDAEEQRAIASGMLRKLDYRVKTVPSGEKALDYMKDNSVDLLVLDMIMDPGISGLETYKRILELHPKQKAVIASGFSKTQNVKEAQRLGIAAFVKKPYLLEKIGRAVRDALDK